MNLDVSFVSSENVYDLDAERFRARHYHCSKFHISDSFLVDKEKLHGLLDSFKHDLISTDSWGFPTSGVSNTYLSEKFYCKSIEKNEVLNFTFISSDKELVDETRKLVFSCLGTKPDLGHVNMLCTGADGPYLKSIGKINQPFNRDNYPREVLEAFDHIRGDLISTSPCGRLSVLEGVPGTGKTYFIKGLVTEVPAKFVYVPSSALTSLTSPELMGVIFSDNDYGLPSTEESEVRGSSTILILEDADIVLAKRQLDNSADVSSLLNFGDGMLGSIADVKILATTNVDKTSLDEAVKRPGRMCSYVKFDKLWADQIEKIYDANDFKGEIKAPMTLAEVYAKMRNRLPEKTVSKIGFV